MTGPLYLAWRYLASHRIKTGILVASIALIIFVPAGLSVLVEESARELTARAQSTPLLLGARASALELVLNSLYFDSKPPSAARYEQVAALAASGLAEPIPLHVRFRAAGQPIVGTSLEYFEFRGLRVREGRQMAVLGECVLGAGAARALGLGPGDTLVSSPETVFDLASVYPLRMKIVGVLAPSHTPDDHAVFVDIKTAWIIEGLGHGHQDLTGKDAESAVMAREADRITANASLVEYNEISAENVDSFHFHGDLSEYPVTGVIAVPHDDKSRVLLMGRYEGADIDAQILRPTAVMDDLLDTILTIQSYVVAGMGTVALGTLATAALVFMLSLRLRRGEVMTLHRIGASRASVATLLVSEVVFVLLAGMFLAGGLTLLARQFGSAAIRAVLIS